MVTNQEALVATAPDRTIQLVFTITLALSAGLLFWIQPLFAKMVLPLLGGTPSVWNTAMVFFQASLLAGYAYAHFSTRLLDLRRQSLLHLAILASAIAVLPISVAAGWTPPTATTPVFWLLALLAVSIGLPFFAVAATAPLLQKWFAHTPHRDAANPYFLYAASNCGSIVALLAFPVLIEPSFGLLTQGWLWSVGYVALLALIAACAVLLHRHHVADAPAPQSAHEESFESSVSAGLRARWVLLAFVPSSLLLSVTAHITTDLAAVPLLWILPLVLYLLTYVIVFSRRPLLPHGAMVRLHTYVVLLFVVILYATTIAFFPLPLILLFHLLTFFVTAMVCHGELAKRRPTTEHLTEFYLWMSVGGVLGGAFNALLAPLIFDSIVEYPLAIVLACALRPLFAGEARGLWRRDLAYPAVLAAVLLAIYAAGPAELIPPGLLKPAFGLAGAIVGMVVLGFSPRPLRFAAGVAVMLVAANAVFGEFDAAERGRSFFGVHKVVRDDDAAVYSLVHGSTVHGAEAIAPDRWREPLTYYVEDGPIGQVFDALHRDPAPIRVGAVGLGTGTLACYGRPQDDWTFYEIDPEMVAVASDTRFFHYLELCGENMPIRLGDARLTLNNVERNRFDLLVIDAFSSDSIPVHLITREAVALYFDKLSAGGLLAIHVSNRFLNLEPVIGNLAGQMGLTGRAQVFQPEEHPPAGMSAADAGASPPDSYRFVAKWIVLARDDDALGPLAADERWSPLATDDAVGLWTDDFSNVFRVIQW